MNTLIEHLKSKINSQKGLLSTVQDELFLFKKVVDYQSEVDVNYLEELHNKVNKHSYKLTCLRQALVSLYQSEGVVNIDVFKPEDHENI